jgi:release factor glutamine methyltransferase
MVEMILAKWGSGVLPRPSGTTPLRIADICTGSGCIAVTLAKLLQSSGCSVEITAVDICPDALALAKENAALHGVGESIRFVCADLRGEGFVEKVGALENSPRGNFGTFDVIVSNPPYIATGELDSLQREVRDHEPRLALDGGVCGMDLYEQLLPKAKLLLRPGGMIYLEIGSEKVVDLAREVGFGDVQLHFDYAGLPRVVVGVG